MIVANVDASDFKDVCVADANPVLIVESTLKPCVCLNGAAVLAECFSQLKSLCIRATAFYHANCS